MLERLNEVKEPKALKPLYRGFQKLKEHYVKTIGGLTLSEKIDEQRKLLMRLEGRRLEYERWQDALERKYGAPLDKMLPVIAELAIARERFGLTASQVQAVSLFVSEMIRKGWKTETIAWYVCAHFQTLLDMDHLKEEKQRLEKEIRELGRRRNEMLTQISNLKAESRKIAKETHALKVVRGTIAKMLNEEMELIGKAEINNLVLGVMYKEGVDALASAILNDQRLQVMLMKAVVTPSLAELAKTFVEIVEEKSDQIKMEATKLSLIAEILQRQIRGKTLPSNNEGDREKRLTLSELLGPRVSKIH